MGFERLVWFIVPVGLITLGVFMIFWPGAMAVMNRDEKEDSAPPSASEVWWTRAVGVVLLVGGLYFLYRMIGGTWGAGEAGDGAVGI